MAMFTVSEFGRLAQVAVTTLRYYDEIGLLPPADTDPLTGYRRYSADQLPRLNRILALRGLGFSLDQIRGLIDNPPSREEMRGMLLLRRAEAERDRATVDARIADLMIRLKHLEQEHTVPEYDILTKTVPAVLLAGARASVAHDQDIRAACIALDTAACQIIDRLRLSVTGPCLALYFPADADLDVEMAYPVNAGAEDEAADPGVHRLDAVDVAYAVYHGSYDDFGAVARLHVAIKDWVGERLDPAAPVRELYLQPPAEDSRDGVMELQYPLLPVR